MNLEYHENVVSNLDDVDCPLRRGISVDIVNDGLRSCAELKFLREWGLGAPGNLIPFEVMFERFVGEIVLTSNAASRDIKSIASTSFARYYISNDVLSGIECSRGAVPCNEDGRGSISGISMHTDRVVDVLPYGMKLVDLSLEGQVPETHLFMSSFRLPNGIFENVISFKWGTVCFQTERDPIFAYTNTPTVISKLAALTSLDLADMDASPVHLLNDLSSKLIGEINSRAVLTGVLHPSTREGDPTLDFETLVRRGLFVPLFDELFALELGAELKTFKQTDDVNGRIRVVCSYATVRPELNSENK